MNSELIKIALLVFVLMFGIEAILLVAGQWVNKKRGLKALTRKQLKWWLGVFAIFDLAVIYLKLLR